MKRLILIAGALAASLVAGQAAPDNLLIVTVDTLRADRLGCYGYQGSATPNFDRWAREGIVFERAFSEVPLTLPSHAGIMTGTLPFYHGVSDNAGFALPGERTTLAETLKAKGYQTAAFVSSYVLDRKFGLAQGFDVYDEPRSAGGPSLLGSALLERPARQTSDLFLDWLQAHERKKPFFAWVHFYDPHAPYEGGYDAEVGRVDSELGRIDGALRSMGLIDQTHILLLADHGESLGEHGESAHGFFVYDSSLHVPLIIRPAKSSNLATGRVSDSVGLIEITPTALQLLGLESSKEFQARGLMRLLLGRTDRERTLYAESLMARLQFGWGSLRSIRAGRYKFIEAPKPELFDLENDPGETRNLFENQQALGLRLRQQLQEFRTRYSSREAQKAAVQIDPETAQNLASLGYAALATPLQVESESGSVDPKDRIQVFEAFQTLLSEVLTGASRATLNRISEIRKTEPDFRGLSFLEALTAEQLGQLPKAQELYRKALSESADNNLIRLNLARVTLQLGQVQDARLLFEQALSADPADYKTRNNLALILRSQGREEQALAEFQKVVDQAPDYSPGWVNRGASLAQQGRFAEAEESLRKAISIDPSNAPAHLTLAQVLNRLGKTEEARRELEKAKALDPGILKKPR